MKNQIFTVLSGLLLASVALFSKPAYAATIQVSGTITQIGYNNDNTYGTFATFPAASASCLNSIVLIPTLSSGATSYSQTGALAAYLAGKTVTMNINTAGNGWNYYNQMIGTCTIITFIMD